MRRAAATLRRLGPLLAALLVLRLDALALEDPADRLRVTALENGLTVLTLEDRSTPVVSFQVFVRVGSADEGRYTGLAHLFEHMMFKGSAHLAPEQHARLVEERGGRVNAYTGRDQTVYYEDVAGEHLPLVVALEAERIRHLDISEKTLEREREVVLEERRLRTEESPQGTAFEELLALSFKAHPYRRPVIGWRSDLEKVGVKACRDFFRTYYAPDNLVLVVVGDFETPRLLELVREHFGDMEPRGEIPRNPTEEPEQNGERRAVVGFPDLRGPLLFAAWHAPPAGSADSAALDVASQILSAGRSSRLYRALVHEGELALAAQGGYWELRRAGVFFAFASVRPGVSVEEVEGSFFAEIDRLAREGPKPAEVAKAATQLEVDLVRGLRTAHGLASRIGHDWLTFGRVRPLAERLGEIRAVTPEDVARVVRTYLVPERRTVVHLLPAPATGADDAPSPSPASAVRSAAGSPP